MKTGVSAARRLHSLWPELIVGASWLILILASHFVFGEDDSLGHHAMHVGLWLALAVYVAMTFRQHRSSVS
jgi:hypothetical protein